MPLLLFSRTKARTKWRWKAVLLANKKFQSNSLFNVDYIDIQNIAKVFKTIALLSIWMAFTSFILCLLKQWNIYIFHHFKKPCLHYIIIQAVLLTRVFFFQNIIICLTCICFELGCGCYQYTQSNITLASNLIFSVIVTIAYFCVPFMTKLTFLFAPFHVSVYPYGYYISCITKTHMYTLVCNLWSEKCTFGYTSRRSPWMQ